MSTEERTPSPTSHTHRLDLLGRLGDELEGAVATSIRSSRQLRRVRRHRSRRSLAAAAGVAVVLVGGGTAAAVALLTPDQVADGLPRGAMVFVGSDPVCTALTQDTFECVVDGGVVNPSRINFDGHMDTFNDPDNRVAGGCRSGDAAGSVWMCYLGMRAVEERILVPEVLGQHMPSPGVG